MAPSCTYVKARAFLSAPGQTDFGAALAPYFVALLSTPDDGGLLFCLQASMLVCQQRVSRRNPWASQIVKNASPRGGQPFGLLGPPKDVSRRSPGE
ncbi:hypothetical protein MTO96_000118 [Rhipicephalus appendiculatus]